jgi:hypothetical protein
MSRPVMSSRVRRDRRGCTAAPRRASRPFRVAARGKAAPGHSSSATSQPVVKRLPIRLLIQKITHSVRGAQGGVQSM